MAIYHNRLAIVPETAQSGKKFFHHGLHGLLWIITGSNQLYGTLSVSVRAVPWRFFIACTK